VKRIIRGLAGLNIVGADIVEVSPAYDTNAELTAMAAADLALEFLSLMVADGPQPASKGGKLNEALREHQASGNKKGKSPVGFTNQAGGGAARDEL
jgi:agmatinase